MLKFTTMQLIGNEDVKGMISVVCQHEILSCIELYANIQLHTSFFTQFLFAQFSTNLLGSQTFDVNEDQLQPYLSAPIVEPDLPNKELNCFSEDEHEVQHNQPQEDHEEELSLFHQQQLYHHHITYHHTCIILKILNTTIALITKKTNIQWAFSLKGCISNKTRSTTCFATVSHEQRR